MFENEKELKDSKNEIESASPETVFEEVKNLNTRLVEISELKETELSSSEKKELRKEVIPIII
jgi:hypothetical protein